MPLFIITYLKPIGGHLDYVQYFIIINTVINTTIAYLSLCTC